MNSCDACTDKTRAYRLSIQDYLKEYYTNTMIIVVSEGIRIYDEQRYEYQREKIQCPLYESLICRLEWFSIKRLSSVRQ